MSSVSDLERLRLVLLRQEEELDKLTRGIDEPIANGYIFVRHVCRGMQNLHDYVLFVRDKEFKSDEIWEGYMETDRVRRIVTYKQQSYSKCCKFIDKIHLIRLLLPMGAEFEMSSELLDSIAYRKVNHMKISMILETARTWLDMSKEDAEEAIQMHRSMDATDVVHNV
jgi:hypothetical protein